VSDGAPGIVDQLAPTPPAHPRAEAPAPAPAFEDPAGPIADIRGHLAMLQKFQGQLISDTGKLNLAVAHFQREAQSLTAAVTGIHGSLQEIRDAHATKVELKELADAVQRLTLACVTIIDQQKEILARLPGRRPAARSKAARTRGEVS
jgi:hypothetical protein